MPSPRGAFSFDEVLPRLVVAYETGRLVPFIGVGMSRPHCADWAGLVRGLESAAGLAVEDGAAADAPDGLIRRANHAVRKLRASRPGAFDEALTAALFTGRESVPPQMQALARIWWPLVLTTNYDDYYVKAFDDAFDALSLAVVGRGSADCQRVLTSLGVAGRALLWAIQGHVAAPSHVKAHEADARLTSELVIDHSEYRRVTYREPHFRRAFAEVFRNRSFLFLGSGLKENYIQELFGEVLELYGPSTRGHYAIMPYGEVDPRFMYARFQIAVVEYGAPDAAPDHAYVPRCLEALQDALERSEAAPVSWTWGTVDSANETFERGRPDLEIVRGSLPTERTSGECLAVSAGGALADDRFHVSRQIRATLDAWCGGRPGEPERIGPYVGEYSGCDAFAVRARAEHEDVKDLLRVRDAARALFDAAAPRYRVIRMQLLAAGGGGEKVYSRWSARPFPARFSLAETVRAWGEWRRDHAQQDLRLTLYVVDPSVSRELVSGRIDILELLRCPDVSFWTEIVEDGVLLERRRFQVNESTSLGAIVDELSLDQGYWNIETSPPTDITASAGPVRLDGQRLGMAMTSLSLRELGILPGGTMHFTRRVAPGGDRVRPAATR